MAMLAWMMCLLVMARSERLHLQLLESLVMQMVTARRLALLAPLGSGHRWSGSSHQLGSPC